MTSTIGTYLAALMLAQPPARTRYTMADLYLPLGALIVSLLVLAIVVFVMKRWYERSRNEDEEITSFLSEAREMEEEGELTKEEYAKIKAKLAAGLQGPKNVPTKGGDPAKRSNPPPRQNPPEP